jgi:hypothetical protein
MDGSKSNATSDFSGNAIFLYTLKMIKPKTQAQSCLHKALALGYV